MQYVEKRTPVSVLLLSIITCGLYLIYWYYCVYRDLEQLDGKTPTGNSYLLDLLLVVITCSLYGIYVDYMLSQQINEMNRKRDLPANDTGTLVVVLDLFAYLNLFFSNFITSMIHQDHVNRIIDVDFPSQSGSGPGQSGGSTSSGGAGYSPPPQGGYPPPSDGSPPTASQPNADNPYR